MPRHCHLARSRVSADGRYVVFISSAGLVEQDRNQLRDVYVTDLASGRTTLESAGPDGLSGNGASTVADISGDGRYVVFESEAGDLTGTQFSNGTPRVFLRDRTDRTTRLLTTNAAGEPGNGPSWNPVISADAAEVAFESGATDLDRIRGGTQRSRRLPDLGSARAGVHRSRCTGRRTIGSDGFGHVAVDQR